LGFITFYIWPFIVSLYYSFLSKPVGGTFVGFSNFTALLTSNAYIMGLTNTSIFMVVCIPFNMALSLGLAILINKSAKYKPLFSLVFLIPLVIPSGSTVFFWRGLVAYDGYVNNLLAMAGITRVDWMATTASRYVVTLIFIWKNLGYNMILFLAGLSNIPKEYYEAAHVDGAGSFKTFISITLPSLLPTIVLVTIMSIVNSFKVFKEVYMLMGDYPHESVYMLQHFMNNNFFALNYPRLTSATTLLVLAITLLTQALFRTERKVTNV
jgi:multiple sugar transport system permease protein